MEREIKFQIVVDNKEATTALTFTDAKLQELESNLQQAGITGTEAGEEIAKGAAAPVPVIDALNMAFNTMQNEIEENESGVETFGKLSTSAAALESNVKKVGKSLQQIKNPEGMAEMGQHAGAAKMAIMNLNYALQDSPYLLQNFNIGFMSIANNLPMIIQGFNDMRATTGSAGAAFKSLAAVIRGPMGVGLAFSALIALVQGVGFALSKTGKEARKTSSDIDLLRNKLEDLKSATRGELNLQTEGVAAEIRSLLKKANLGEKDIFQFERAIYLQSKYASELEKVRIKLLEKESINKEELKYLYMYNDIRSIQEKVNKKLEDDQKTELKNLSERLRKLNLEILSRGKLGEIEAEINRLRREQRSSKSEERILEIQKEINALEEERKKLTEISGPEEQSKDLSYLERKRDLLNQILILEGKKSELEVLQEEEERLERVLSAGKLEVKARQEKEIQLLQIKASRIKKEKELEEQQQSFEQELAEREQRISELRNRQIMQKNGSGISPLELDLSRLENQLTMFKSQYETLMRQISQMNMDVTQSEAQERILKAADLEEKILQIEQQIADKKHQLSLQAIADAEREKQARINASRRVFSGLLDSISALSQAEDSANRQRLEQEKEVLLKKLEKEKEERLAHATTTKQKEKLEKEYEQKRINIEKSYEQQSRAIGRTSFELQKKASIASALMSTYEAAAAALKPPPIGAGPVLGPILAAATIAAGMIQVKAIEAQPAPGFKDGGLIELDNTGKIKGSGGPEDDAILALASEGGYVINAYATEKFYPVLQGISDKKLIRVSDGEYYVEPVLARKFKPLLKQINSYPDKKAKSVVKDNSKERVIIRESDEKIIEKYSEGGNVGETGSENHSEIVYSEDRSDYPNFFNKLIEKLETLNISLPYKEPVVNITNNMPEEILQPIREELVAIRKELAQHAHHGGNRGKIVAEVNKFTTRTIVELGNELLERDHLF